jgi:hypothetical protein
MNYRLAQVCAVVVGLWCGSTFAVTGTATINCTEQNIANGKKELTCALGEVKFVVPNTVSLPSSANGNSFDLTTQSSGFTCNPTVTGVAGGSQQTSTFTANCSGNTPPTTFAWSALDATAATAASLSIANSAVQDTTATLTLGTNVASLGIRLTACQSAGVGCQNFDRAVTNTSLVLTPTNCALTGVPSAAVSEQASLSLGVTGCQNLQSPTSYTWRYNGASIGSGASVSHIPFPTGTSATSGVYSLVVCNPNGNTSAGCMTVPNANGVTVTKAQSSGGELALCPSGARIEGQIDLGREGSKLFSVYSVDNGDVPIVFRVIVPNPTPAGETQARLTWNSSIGAAAGKTIKISRNQACGTVGASTLGTTWSSGARNVNYTTGPSALLPYFDAGSVWYVMVTTPACTQNCNFNLEIFK